MVNRRCKVVRIDNSRFAYVVFDEESNRKQAWFRESFEALESYALRELPDSRERSLYLTALEQAYMWTGKMIRDSQNRKNHMAGINGN